MTKICFFVHISNSSVAKNQQKNPNELINKIKEDISLFLPGAVWFAAILNNVKHVVLQVSNNFCSEPIPNNIEFTFMKTNLLFSKSSFFVMNDHCIYIYMYIYIYIYIRIHLLISVICKRRPKDNRCWLFVYRIYEVFHINPWKCLTLYIYIYIYIYIL